MNGTSVLVKKKINECPHFKFLFVGSGGDESGGASGGSSYGPESSGSSGASGPSWSGASGSSSYGPESSELIRFACIFSFSPDFDFLAYHTFTFVLHL